MHPTMLLLTVQREREAELERLAIRRPLWRERSPAPGGEANGWWRSALHTAAR